MKIRLGEINLWVRDIERAAQFYMEALGFEVTERGDTWIKLSCDHLVMLFFQCEDGDPAPGLGTQPCMSADLVVDDLDAAVEQLSKAGAEVEGIQTEDDHRFTFIRDLDGITWELIEARPEP